MLIQPKLSKSQYRYFASFAKTIADGILLGSSAAFFLPETFQLREPISIDRYILFGIIGLTCLIGGAILERKGNNYYD